MKQSLFSFGTVCIILMLCCSGNLWGQGSGLVILGPVNQSNTMSYTTHSFDSVVYVFGSYNFTGAGTENLLIRADGECNAMPSHGGFVWLSDAVIVDNNRSGWAKILSTNHYVKMDANLTYQGFQIEKNAVADTTFLVSGKTGVDIVGKTAIQLDSTGHVAFRSSDGHVHLAGELAFEQKESEFYVDNVNAANFYGGHGFSILAQGPATGSGDCNNRPTLGYVWIEGPIKIDNKGHGFTSIKSEHHHILLGGEVEYTGEKGDLMVIAGTDKDDPGDSEHVSCANAEIRLPNYYVHASANLPYLVSSLTDLYDYNAGDYENEWTDKNPLPNPRNFTPLGTLNFSHPGRGYVRFEKPVTLVLESVGQVNIESKSDVVQFDKTLEFTGNKGGDLVVKGYYGVRVGGEATLENVAFVDSVSSDHTKKWGGFTEFYSGNSFIDFEGRFTYYAHQANERGKRSNSYDINRWRMSYNFNTIRNNPDFNFAETFGHGKGSYLSVSALKRVLFKKDITISIDSAYGYAKIHARRGFVNFRGQFVFDGTPAASRAGGTGSVSTPGDLLIVSNGFLPSARAEVDTFPNCRGSIGGAILFQNDAHIAVADTGRTLIKAITDDVILYKNFSYLNDPAHTAGAKNENGQFWMQAGQDILGKNLKGTSFGQIISFRSAGEKSIVLEAKGTIRTQQSLLFERPEAKAGSILLKAGFEHVHARPFRGYPQSPELLDTLDNNALGWNGPWKIANPACPPRDYENRKGGIQGPDTIKEGGDIWFEGRVNVDLSTTAASNHNDSVIHTLIGASHAVYIDSSFNYVQAQQNSPDYKSGYLKLFARDGNIEAVQDGQIPGASGAPVTTVGITIDQPFNTTDIQLTAGLDPLFDGLYNVMDNCCTQTTQWEGNILFNKPLFVASNAKGGTLLAAKRDIETQVDAPFLFTYTNKTDSLQDLQITAGRHIETHKKMTVQYDTDKETTAQVVIKAGTLDKTITSGNAYTEGLGKKIELGSALTANYQPSAGSSNDPYEPNGTHQNNFSGGGAGNGSILLFDSVEINYDGNGTISLLALNGNIESDPYLHKNDATRGNNGQGYDGAGNVHDAPIVINHSGTGNVQLSAIDIKLHDKLEYNGSAANQQKNGRLSLQARDSILTRNIRYSNPTDTGSVFITTDKYKENWDKDYVCVNGGPGIHLGHIVLGYGADCGFANINDSIVFDYNSIGTNTSTEGANIRILAGYEGFVKNNVTGKQNASLFSEPEDKGKGYGGNITFDYMEFYMPTGNGMRGGSTEISTPNGNIWGKDSILYRGMNGHLLVDAGLGSKEDDSAIRWGNISCVGGKDNILNTQVLINCVNDYSWRTGNIMMKGATLNFGAPGGGAIGTGNATFRTREGFIDTYDAFTVDSMQGHLLKYAVASTTATTVTNQWGDVSERDFRYTPVENSGSVFFGADDNIMLNYGNSNDYQSKFSGRGQYDIAASGQTLGAAGGNNPFYWTSYEGFIDGLCASRFNVNEHGYLWYRSQNWEMPGLHQLYRGCTQGGVCSPLAGVCKTSGNGARDLMLHFDTDEKNQRVKSGGFAAVATNYIDLFTKFEYFGGSGSGLHVVPDMRTLKGENVQGYGLYMKSQFNGVNPEKRRATCENCGGMRKFEIQGRSSYETAEWPYLGFHDDARIHTQGQRSLLEAPVIEFFGHAELDAFSNPGTKTHLIVKADSLIFHDSAIFDGARLNLLPYTTGAQRTNDMRYGVINDDGPLRKLYASHGPAIEMSDREMPVLEFGYQRCVPPASGVQNAPNFRSESGLEATPKVGGDIIVAFKHDFSLPILNSVVANHARISFISDSIDQVSGGEYIDACIRTDLLRIRNKVEFYTDPTQPNYRKGLLKMTSNEQMPTQFDTGIYPHHLHLEPNSELSLPGENSLIVIPSTTVGGYGNLHENIYVEAHGILAPGYASLMESDCQTPKRRGKLTVHNLTMEQDAVLRVSIGYGSCLNPVTGVWENCVQADTLVVEDYIFMHGRTPIQLLPEIENIEAGCYLIMEYGDVDGVSKEYIKNLYLTQTRYGDTYFNLDFTEPGKVYLCAGGSTIPDVKRYIEIPAVEGVVTQPKSGKCYVSSKETFSFTATYGDSPLKVTAKGYYTGTLVVLDNTAEDLGGNTYRYTLRQIVEPWHVFIGPELATGIVSNEDFRKNNVWTYKNTLYVKTEAPDVVSIYTLTGVLYRKYNVSEGLSTYTLEKGIYVVMLKDGTVYKVIIR